MSGVADNNKSVLGRSKIIKSLTSGKISVSPILAKEQIGAASVDLRMGNVVLVVRSRGASHVDPKYSKLIADQPSSYDLEADRRQKHERFEIPFKRQFLLHPGSLALVPTLEWVQLPADIIGTVTARSTWAREGLSIATANIIEPSYNGIVTLELANLGEIPICLYPGMKLAQISFAKVDGDTSRPDKSQFSLSFEPTQGSIIKGDEKFIP